VVDGCGLSSLHLAHRKPRCFRLFDATDQQPTFSSSTYNFSPYRTMNNIAAVDSIEVLLQAPLRIKAGSEPHQPELIKIPLSIGAPPAVVTPTLASDDRMNLCGNDAKVGRWTETEHAVFLEGLSMHGKQWKTIATMIGTRSVVQVRTHAQKYFQKLDRKIKPNTPAPKRKGTPTDVPSGACEQAKKPKRVSARLSLSGPKKPSAKRNALALPVTSQSLAPEVLSSK
jgi:SHAQKYF class myb-like DNA-binding protein